jgi:hypothetical protein
VYDRFQETFYGIYYLASGISTRSQAQNLGHFLASQLRDPADPSVRVQTMQHNLLTATNAVLQQQGQLPTGEEYGALEQAVMRMAYTYGLYNPAKMPDAPGATQPDFLNRLWWAQNEYQADQLDDGMANLATYLQGVEQPAKAMQFVSNLLLAAKQTVGIQEDLQDPLFFQELLKFGFEYAKLNPDTSLSAEPQGFLDTLWRAEAGTSEFKHTVRIGVSGLSTLFKELETFEQKNKALKYESNMLNLAKQTSNFQMNQLWQDPLFLDRWLSIGRSYLTSDPLALLESNQSPQNFFLNTLWDINNEPSSNISQAVTDLELLLQNFDYNLEPTETQPLLAFNHGNEDINYSEERQTPLIAGISIDELLCKVGWRRKATTFEPLPKYRNSQGLLTDGRYTVVRSLMEPHETGYPDGTSQFLNGFTGEAADSMVLDAARLADHLCLWTDGGRKAKVQILNGPIGTLGRTGTLTNWITIHRRANGNIHGHPSSP